MDTKTFHWYLQAIHACLPLLPTYQLTAPKLLLSFMLSMFLPLLSTHADRQGVDISFTVVYFAILCVCVCLYVTDFSSVDKAGGVKFCTTVHRQLRQGISHFEELCFTRSPKSDDESPARTLNYKWNWKEPSIACRPRLTEVRAPFYL